MGKLFNIGVVTAIIGVIVILGAYGLTENISLIPLPPHQVKLIAVFVFGAGITMAVSGIICIMISTAIGEEAIAKAMGVTATQITPEIIKLSVVVIIVVGGTIALITGKLTPEYFMQLVSMILGMLGGSVATYVISKLFRTA